MKTIILALLCVGLLATDASAKLSEAEITSVAHFLVLDFASVSHRNAQRPATRTFLVKETHERVFRITREDIGNRPRVKGVVEPGTYREIQIVNEIEGIGAVVRYAFINDSKRVYWANADQSLLNFAFRPELGNTGVLRLLDHSVEPPAGTICDVVCNSQKGRIPSEIKASDEEIQEYASRLSAMWDVFMAEIVRWVK